MAAVRKQLSVLTLFILTCYSSFVSSLFFQVTESKQRCFIQKTYELAVVIGDFRLLTDALDVRIQVDITDPEDQLVLSELLGSKGKFTFTSHQAGCHVICLRAVSSGPRAAGDTLSLHLEIIMGERTNNYTQIAAEERLSELRLRVRQLTQQVQQIQEELAYQRVREMHFRDVSLSTTCWIFWWPVIRSLYVVLFIMWSTNTW